ncbi:unnamed protein product, partial [Aphanomyces euteiches]
MDPTNCVQGQGRENSPPEFHNDTEDKTAVETTEENGDITPTNCVQGQGRDPHEMKRQPICRRVRFSTVTIISFPSELGECSLPSVGGFPLGMTQQHSDAATFNLETFTDDARPCVSKIPPRERKSRLVAAGVTEKDIKAYDAAVAVIHGSRWSEVKRATERNTMLHEAKCWNSILRQRRQDASWEFKQRDYDRDMTKKRRAMDDEADVSCAQRRKNDHHTTATSARSDVETEVPQWIEHEKHKFRLEMLAQAKQYNIMAHFQRQSLKTSQGQPHGAPHISENHTNACSPNIEVISTPPTWSRREEDLPTPEDCGHISTPPRWSRQEDDLPTPVAFGSPTPHCQEKEPEARRSSLSHEQQQREHMFDTCTSASSSEFDVEECVKQARPIDPKHEDGLAREVDSFRREHQDKYWVKHDYLAEEKDGVQCDINPSMRGILMDWLVKMGHIDNLAPHTLHLAMHLVDRCLSVMKIAPGKLVLLGCACMMLAYKFDAVVVDSFVEHFVNISDHTKDEMLAMENLVLEALEYQLA